MHMNLNAVGVVDAVVATLVLLGLMILLV